MKALLFCSLGALACHHTNINSQTKKATPDAPAVCRVLVNLPDGVIEVRASERLEVKRAEGWVLRDNAAYYALGLTRHSLAYQDERGSTLDASWSSLIAAPLPAGPLIPWLTNKDPIALPSEGQQFRDQQELSVVGIFGPYVMIEGRYDGYTGGAHGIYWETQIALTLPDKNDQTLGALGPEVLTSLQEATARESDARNLEQVSHGGEAEASA